MKKTSCYIFLMLICFIAISAEPAYAGTTPATVEITHSYPNPSTVGDTVTFYGEVTPGATGTVTYYDGSTVLGSRPIWSGGITATFTINGELSAGSHSVTAVYSGDANYTGSTSAVFTHVVNPAATTTTITSSVNPSAYGQSVTFTATVPWGYRSGFFPTGIVTFYDGNTSIGTGALSGSIASLSVSSLSVDSHSVTAVYSGDSNNAGSTSAIYTQVVDRAATTVTLTSSANPSTLGEAVTFTATLPPDATGSVDFKDGGVTMPGGSHVSVSGGRASFTTPALSSGSHSVTADYSGNSNYAGSTSATLTQVIRWDSYTTLTSSLNPSTYGQSITFTATVPAGATGTVTFNDGSATLGTSTISGGTATFSTSALAGGSHSITASYSGDGNYAASTSSALNQEVNRATTTITLTSLTNPSTYGQSITFTATMPAGATGTVTFNDGSATLGTATVSGGTATFTTSSLPAGSHSITATYSGDANYASSTSTVLVQKVKEVTSASLTSSSNPSLHWSSVTLTATVTGLSTPTGTVEFLDGASSLAVVALDGSGRASLTTSDLAVGSHSLSAVYSGDSDHAGSTSAVLVQVLSLNPPVASFTSNVTSGDLPVTVKFTDTSSNWPTAWLWDFGDGSAKSAEANPVHTYVVPSSCRVTLTVWNSDGSSTVAWPDYIRVIQPGAPLTISMDEMYAHLMPTPSPGPSPSPSPSASPSISPTIIATPASTPVVAPTVTTVPLTSPAETNNAQPGISYLWVLLALVALLGIAGAVYFLVLKK